MSKRPAPASAAKIQFKKNGGLAGAPANAAMPDKWANKVQKTAREQIEEQQMAPDVRPCTNPPFDCAICGVRLEPRMTKVTFRFTKLT